MCVEQEGKNMWLWLIPQPFINKPLEFYLLHLTDVRSCCAFICLPMHMVCFEKNWRQYINIVHVPVTQAILQNAPLLTEVHATNVPENLLRNPSLFPIYPPFDMKQEMGKKILSFSAVFLPFVSEMWLALALLQLSRFFCCSWADSFAAHSSWDFWPLEENSGSTNCRFSVHKYFFRGGYHSILLSLFPKPPAKASITFSYHPCKPFNPLLSPRQDQ